MKRFREKESVFFRILTIPDEKTAARILSEIGADEAGVSIMAGKWRTVNVFAAGLPVPAALIMKQEMLSAGGDAAIARGCVAGSAEKSDVLLMGTPRQFGRFIGKLSMQPFGLAVMGGEIKKLFRRASSPPPLLTAKGKTLRFGQRTLIMGILNVTGDSFYDGSRFPRKRDAVRCGNEMLGAGADLIDVGGESTRPGAKEVDPDEEIRRVIPVISELAKNAGAFISVDTRKSEVAEAALAAGASMINDVSGLRFDPRIAEAAAGHQAALCVMHSIGTPADMQQKIAYGSLMTEIFDFLCLAVEKAVLSGVRRSRIIVDPGIGFGKTADHNFEIMARLGELRSLGCAVMAGPSRKSFIGAATGKPPEERLHGTMAAVAAAALAGADIVRVHDVPEAIDAARVADAIRTGRITAD